MDTNGWNANRNNLHLRGELMTKPMVKLVNAETGEEIVREMNAEELKQWEKDIAEANAEKEALAAKAAQRQAILDRLGLTADEAALLLGAN